MSRIPAIFLTVSLSAVFFVAGCADNPQDFMPTNGQSWPVGTVDALLVDENGQVRHEEMAFQDVVDTEGKTVVLDFWAQWCGPCRMLSPELETLAADRSDILVVKINVDQNQELASQFQVNSIPAVHVLKDGQWLDRFAGFRDSDSISDFVSAAQ